MEASRALFLKRCVMMVVGILFISICVGCYRLSGFGVDAFTCMNLGISGFLQMSFGTWQLIMNAVILVLRRQIRRPLREPVIMHYLWVEKDRRRDKDNVSSGGRKIIQDALVKMKALKNDGWANIDSFSDAFSVDKKRPRIEIEIEEAE